MSDEVIVRHFRKDDVDEVYDLIMGALETYVIQKVYEKSTLDIWKTFYTKKYIAGCTSFKHVYVATINDKIVGSAACELMGDEAYISMVYINPNYQGKGIGKKLILNLEQDEYCQKTKYLTMSAALSAVKFYQKYGYHHKDDSPEIILDCGVEYMHLEKRL